VLFRQGRDVVTDTAGIARILTLVFTDLSDSTALKAQRGDQAVGALLTRHRAHVRELAAQSDGRIINWAGDGFLTFDTPSAAVLFGLRLQQLHHEEPDLPSVRTGIHMGEVSERSAGSELPMVLTYSAFVLTMAGHPPEESIALIQRAMRLSPHDPFEFFFYDALGVSYFCAGRYADGVAAGRRLMALRPTYTLGSIYAAMSAAELGHIDEAHDLMRQARGVQPDLSFALAHTALGGMAPDVDRRVSAALRKAGLE
jgi:tetratricopeptide (TPR) repeat protein